jgi:hypothetical protein
MTVINSAKITQAFAEGPLWVSIFEQAFLARDSAGYWNPNNPKFSNVEGSNTTYSALKAILGVDVNEKEIPDMADPAERRNAFASNTNNEFGMNQTLFFEQAMNAAEIGKPLVQNAVKAQIFRGQQNLFATFLAWAQAQDMTARPMMAIQPAPNVKGLVAGSAGNRQPNNPGFFSCAAHSLEGVS